MRAENNQAEKIAQAINFPLLCCRYLKGRVMIKYLKQNVFYIVKAADFKYR